MVMYENECVGCGLPCVAYCPYLEVPHYYCDKCGKEVYLKELFTFDNEVDLCYECAKKYACEDEDDTEDEE